MKKLDWFDQVLALQQSYSSSSLMLIILIGINVSLLLVILIIVWLRSKLIKPPLDQDVLQLAQLWIERTGDAIAWFSAEGFFVYANEATCRILGYSQDELRSMDLGDIDEGILTASIWLDIWQSLQKQNSLSWVTHYRRKNGQAFPVEITGSYLQWNNQEYACCMARDISAYKQVEETLSKAHTDLEQRAITVGKANQELHNTLKQLQAFEDYLLYQDKQFQTIRQQADIQWQRYQDLFNLAPEGYLVTDAMGSIQVQRQQTEQIRLALEHERELRRLQLHFFSRVSHEFRTPLSSILLSAQSLEQSYQKWPKEKIINNLSRIQICAKNMTQLLEDILTINRAELGHLDFKAEPTNLEQFCQYLLGKIQQIDKNKHYILLKLNSENKQVRLDENLLHFALKNLLLNAIYYSRLESNITFVVYSNPGETIFQIQDEGIGILPEDLPHIFEAFYRGKNIGTIAGTGLGMTVVKQCLDLHRGTISFESKVGIGTTVTVRIPDVCCEL